MLDSMAFHKTYRWVLESTDYIYSSGLKLHSK